MIVGVAFPSEPEEEPVLARKLIRGKLITPEDWKKAYEQHQEGLLGIEKVLAQSEMVKKEDLTAALRLLTFDTIYGLFKWKGGTFRFENRPVSYDPELVEPLQSEYLLLDVLRMVDEWPMIAERLPDFDAIPRKTNPSAALEALNGTPWEKNRSFQMEVVYDLIDGYRSVREIIDLSFVEEFETCKILLLMIDAGLVEPLPTAIPQQEKKKRFRIRVPQNLANPGAYLLAGIIALLLSFGLITTRLSHFPLSRNEVQGWRVFQESLKKVQEAKIKNAREVFFLEKSRYPKDIDEMAREGLLNR
jgi:hypothetical protein